mgnify:CR=1 FL=1
MQLSDPSKPILSPEFAQLVRDSKLELVLCGGLTVGHHTYPKVWLLRDCYEVVKQEEKTKLLQKMAMLARENFELKSKLNNKEVDKTTD